MCTCNKTPPCPAPSVTDINALNLLCLADYKPRTLQELLQVFIQQLCARAGTLPGDSTEQFPEGVVRLPICLEYEEDATGDYITALPVEDLLRLYGTQHCLTLEKITNLEQRQLQLEKRLLALEGQL